MRKSSRLPTRRTRPTILALEFLVLLVTLAVVCPHSLRADDTDQMQSALDSHICPGDASKYDPISYKEYGCKTSCCNHDLDGGDCNGCQIGYEHECAKEVDAKNRIIAAYNAFVASCKHASGGKSVPGSMSSGSQGDQGAGRGDAADASAKFVFKHRCQVCSGEDDCARYCCDQALETGKPCD